MRKRIIAITLLMALLAISNNAIAATGSAKVYYNSNLSVGTTSSIKTILGNMGYTSTRSGNPSVSTVRNSFGSSKVVHILSHGAPGRLCLYSGNLSAVSISNNYNSLSTKFVFLEGCQTAVNSASYGDLDDTLKSLGVKSTLAFSKNVSASTSSDGVHLFANLFYQDIHGNNWSVSTAAAVALNTLYESSGSYHGVDSMVIKGGGTNIN